LDKRKQINPSIEEVWEQIIAYQGCTFFTSKGLEFTYTVKGGEIFFSRKEKSVTRASVEIALEKVRELDGKVSGPKKLACYGSSYLYPVFVWLGLVEQKPKEPEP
jgi:hypothetical protein